MCFKRVIQPNTILFLYKYLIKIKKNIIKIKKPPTSGGETNNYGITNFYDFPAGKTHH